MSDSNDNGWIQNLIQNMYPMSNDKVMVIVIAFIWYSRCLLTTILTIRLSVDSTSHYIVDTNRPGDSSVFIVIWISSALFSQRFAWGYLSLYKVLFFLFVCVCVIQTELKTVIKENSSKMNGVEQKSSLVTKIEKWIIITISLLS